MATTCMKVLLKCQHRVINISKFSTCSRRAFAYQPSSGVTLYPQFDYDPSIDIWKKRYEKSSKTQTQVEESKEDFKHVLKLIPKQTVCEPPTHEQYPTPSGWVPPSAEKSHEYPYYVKRTKNHMYPVYLQTMAGGNRHITVIKHVQGDIWAFEADLKKFIQEKTGKRTWVAVDELCQKVRLRGYMPEYVNEFLQERGC